MRIVYLFTSLGTATLGQNVSWDPEAHSENPSAIGMETEGMFDLLMQLVKRGTIDECFFFVESNRSPGFRRYSDKAYCRVMPHMGYLEDYIQPGDVILARGGFRPWPGFLKKRNEEKKWVLFYRAATNRGGWPYWDIVLDDLIDRTRADEKDGGRLHYLFHKPVREDIFFFKKEERDIDLIINASHIHDKKGQWKAIDALIYYKEIYGKNLKACLPGSWYGGINTLRIPFKIKSYGLDVDTPGMVSRKVLAEIYRRSRLYIHLGGAGQNDRGCLEALACGVPILLGNPVFHPKWMTNNPYSFITPNQVNPESLAYEIHNWLSCINIEVHPQVAKFYKATNGMEVAIRDMETILNFIRDNPIADRQKALEKLP